MGFSLFSIILPSCTDKLVASLYFNDLAFSRESGNGGGCGGALRFTYRLQRIGNEWERIFNNKTPSFEISISAPVRENR